MAMIRGAIYRPRPCGSRRLCPSSPARYSPTPRTRSAPRSRGHASFLRSRIYGFTICAMTGFRGYSKSSGKADRYRTSPPSQDIEAGKACNAIPTSGRRQTSMPVGLGLRRQRRRWIIRGSPQRDRCRARFDATVTPPLPSRPAPVRGCGVPCRSARRPRR